MQSLEIISLNLWQILISLCNLLLLFLIIKHFLYKPVKKVLAQRQAELDKQYQDAENAKQDALADKNAWEQKMQDVKEEAEAMLKTAAVNADRKGDKIISEAKEKAEYMIRQAENEIELKRQKDADGIKREIVDVSTILTEKMLHREIDAEDHRNLIDSFIREIGEDDDRNE